MGPGASIILKKNVFGQLCVKHSGADSIVDKSSGFCQFQIRTNIFFLEYIEANVSAVCPNSWNRKTVRFFFDVFDVGIDHFDCVQFLVSF